MSVFSVWLCIVFLVSSLVALWYMLIPLNFYLSKKGEKVSRGANIMGEGNTVELSCPAGKVIDTINQGRLVCYTSQNGGRTPQCEPNNYDGTFTDSTVDVTADLQKCIGKSSCKYTIPYLSMPGKICNPSSSGCSGTNVGLISTYLCA